MTDVMLAGPRIPLRDVYDTADDTEVSWMVQGLCAETDPEAFFPDRGEPTRAAKRVCRTCDVWAECLEYALAHNEQFGVWGGYSAQERRRISRVIHVPPATGLLEDGDLEDDLQDKPGDEIEDAPPLPAAEYPLCDKGLHELSPGNTCVDLKTSEPGCKECREAARARTAAPLPLVTPVYTTRMFQRAA